VLKPKEGEEEKVSAGEIPSWSISMMGRKERLSIRKEGRELLVQDPSPRAFFPLAVRNKL